LRALRLRRIAVLTWVKRPLNMGDNTLDLSIFAVSYSFKQTSFT
jgi:hypothetical protein